MSSWIEERFEVKPDKYLTVDTAMDAIIPVHTNVRMAHPPAVDVVSIIAFELGEFIVTVSRF